jgi:hypothetical protein
MAWGGNYLHAYVHKLLGEGMTKEKFLSFEEVSETLRNDFSIIPNASARLEIAHLLLSIYPDLDDVYDSFIRIFRESVRYREHVENALYYYASLQARKIIEKDDFFSDPYIKYICETKMKCIADSEKKNKLIALIMFKYYDYSSFMNLFYSSATKDLDVPGSERLLYTWIDPESGRSNVALKTFCQFNESIRIFKNRKMSHEFDERYKDPKYENRAVVWTEAFFRPYYLEKGGLGIDIGCADAPLLAASEFIDIDYGKDMLDMSCYSQEKYDWIHCSQALEHIKKERAEELISDLKNKIYQGGYLFLSTPSPSCYEFNCDLQKELNPFHLWQPSMEQVIGMVKRAGGYDFLDYQSGFPFYDAFVFRRKL